MRYTRGVATTVQEMALQPLVDLVNGWGREPRKEAGEAQQAYPPREDLLERIPLADQSAASVTDAGLARVADLLHPVFAATEASERAARVTELLTDVAVRPALHPSGGGTIQAAWLVPDPRDATLAAAATALRAQLIDHGPDRIGTCAGHRCADVYIDASPGGDRRFCSVTCQTRTRVAAFRQRQTSTR
jgi:predicted RNA-binding Zn ribbon-like protein